MIFDRLNSIQENKIFRALVLDFLELRKHMITWCCWQNSVWTRLMVAVSSEGGTVFPRQLCAMSSVHSVQCPAPAGRWRPAPHTQLLSGPGTSHHAETMHPVWHGMAWLPIMHGTSLSDPGVVLILIQSCAGRRCLQTLFCSHPSLSVLSQTVRSAHNGVTQSSRGSEQMWGSLIASPHHQSSD